MIDKKQKNIPEGWEFKSVGELLDYEQPTNYIVKSTNYNNKYKTPVLTAGKTFLLGYTDEIDGVYNNLPVIIFDDFTTAKKYVDFPFKVKSSAMKILKEKPDIVNLKFIYGWMQIHPFKVGEHKRNYLSEYQYQTVLLPPLPEQTAIVKILETWDKYLEKLSRKIEVKKNIKKGIASQIMNCELLIVNGKKVYAPKVRLSGFSGEWESVKLGDICQRIRTGKLDANAMVENGKYRFYTCAKDFYKIDDYAFDTEALLISGNGANVGYIHYYKGKFNAYQRIYILDRFKNNIFFIKYILDKFLKQRIFAEKCDGNTPYIKMDTLTDMKIKIPKSQEEQTAIAKILTTADKEIEVLEKKKKIIEDQKKYLLNNLVTGNIIVNC